MPLLTYARAIVRIFQENIYREIIFKNTRSTQQRSPVDNNNNNIYLHYFYIELINK